MTQRPTTPIQAEKNYLKSCARWIRSGTPEDEERVDYWRREHVRHIEAAIVAGQDARLFEDISRA